MTFISTSIIGSAVGTVYTDDTDPRRKKKKKAHDKWDKHKRVKWYIR